jgi:hypothetical protein
MNSTRRSAEYLKDAADLATASLAASDAFEAATLARMAASSRFTGSLLSKIEDLCQDAAGGQSSQTCGVTRR